MATKNPEEKKKRKYRRVKTPTLIQMETLECGAACLGIILGYYGCYIPLEELRVACGVTRDGSNALNIIKAARSYGLDGKGYRKELEDLIDMPVPFVVHWGFNHFLVIEGFSKHFVYINDPETGRRKISYSDLDASFTGVVLSFTKNPNFKKTSRPSRFSLPYMDRLSEAKSGLILLTLLGLLLVIPQLALAGFSQVFMDYFLQGKVLWWNWVFLGGLLLISVMIILLSALRQQVLNRMYLKLSLLFSTQFFWHSMFLPLSFFAQRFSGEIANRMALNDGVAMALVRVLADGILNVLIASIFGLSMFYYDSVVASFTIGVVLVSALLIYFIYYSRQDAYAYLQQAIAKSTGFSIGGLYNIETLKATSTEVKYFSRWSGYYTRAVNALQNVSKRDILSGVAPIFFDSLANLTLLMVGVWRIMDGHMTLGMLMALQILMKNFTTPIFTLLGLMQSIQLLKVDSNRLDDVLRNRIDPAFDNNRENLFAPQAGSVMKLDGYLEVKDVSFGFNPNAAPIIRNINLSLSPGKSVALVGPSGCGKSTIAKLIGGFFEPWTGEILLNNTPRSQLKRNIITNSLAMVQQDPSFFSETVKDNITLLEAFPIQNDLIQAAKDACIHEDIINRKGGYDLLLENGGGNLSGGQRQRLEIARALYRNPTILVLDEATSALDSGTEAEVMKNIRRRGCACLMVAHRLSTIKNCDEIIVLSKGQIIQRGTHDELASQPGLYRDLVEIEKLNEQEMDQV